MENNSKIKIVIEATSRVIHEDIEVELLTSGHINQTFLIKNNGEQLILQKLNTTVFKNLESVNQNILTIGKYLKQKEYPNQVLDLIAFKDNSFLFEGEWRLFKYVENTQTFLKVQSSKQAYEAARFLSSFHAHIFDLEFDKINDSIDGFLDFEKRLEQYEGSIRNTSNDRQNRAEEAVVLLNENKFILEDWLKLLPQIPTRIIHADPKISNFLFDENDANKVLALIDWDTILCGSILYDFGDMVRSYTNLKEEDDPKPGNNFSMENYQALKDGFLVHLKDKLTTKEIENLDLGAKVVIYVQAMRFLTDYLNGDTYYSTEYALQNLDRAMSQINLLTDLKVRLS